MIYPDHYTTIFLCDISILDGWLPIFVDMFDG